MDFDKKWVKLSWWAPDESDIKHYIIEMQEQFLVPKDAAPAEEEEGEGGAPEPAADEDVNLSTTTNPVLQAALAMAQKDQGKSKISLNK